MKKVFILLVAISLFLIGCSEETTNVVVKNNIPQYAGNVLGNINNFGWLVQSDEYIYAMDFSEIEPQLCCYNFDGTKNNILYKGNFTGLNIYKDDIYFIDMEKQYINKIDAKGELHIVIPQEILDMHIWKGVIYYRLKSDSKIYSYDIETGQSNKVIDAEIYTYYVYDDYVVYYQNEEGKHILYKYSIEEKVIKNSYHIKSGTDEILPYNDEIIYSTSIGIDSFNTKLNSERCIVADPYIYPIPMVINEETGELYYGSKAFGIRKINLNSNEPSTVINKKPREMFLANDKIYYYDRDTLKCITR